MNDSLSLSDIEAHVREIQEKKKVLTSEEKEEARVGLGEEGHFDTEIYESRGSKFAGYVTSIGTTDEQDVSVHVFLSF